MFLYLGKAQLCTLFYSHVVNVYRQYKEEMDTVRIGSRRSKDTLTHSCTKWTELLVEAVVFS